MVDVRTGVVVVAFVLAFSGGLGFLLEGASGEVQQEYRSLGDEGVSVQFLSGGGVPVWDAQQQVEQELERLTTQDSSGLIDWFLDIFRQASRGTSYRDPCEVVIAYESGSYAHVGETCGISFVGYDDAVGSYIETGDDKGFTEATARFLRQKTEYKTAGCSDDEVYFEGVCRMGRRFEIPRRPIDVVGAQLVLSCSGGTERSYRVVQHRSLEDVGGERTLATVLVPTELQRCVILGESYLDGFEAPVHPPVYFREDDSTGFRIVDSETLVSLGYAYNHRYAESWWREYFCEYGPDRGCSCPPDTTDRDKFPVRLPIFGYRNGEYPKLRVLIEEYSREEYNGIMDICPSVLAATVNLESSFGSNVGSDGYAGCKAAERYDKEGQISCAAVTIAGAFVDRVGIELYDPCLTLTDGSERYLCLFSVYNMGRSGYPNFFLSPAGNLDLQGVS